MALPVELFSLIPPLTGILAILIHYRLANRSGSGLFAYYLLLTTAIAVPVIAVSVASADQVAQAVTDAGILLAGALAFAASGWLLFAFRQTGDTHGR